MLPTQNCKPGKHLEFNHPAMVKIRSWVAMQVAVGEIHPKMVANFDQMWSLLYRPASSSLTKRDKVDPIAKQTSLRRIRHLVERNLGLAITEPMEKDPSEIHSVRVAGGPTASCPVEGWRTPRTLTTLSWCDGTLSRGFVTCREDSITEDQRHQANKAQVFLLCYHLLSVLICALRFVKFFCYNRLSI